jgi:phosphoribosylcarboxyaminoimidazole (NCAIR) mutase
VNAALLATAMLGNKYPEHRSAYESFRARQTAKGLANQEIKTERPA